MRSGSRKDKKNPVHAEPAWRGHRSLRDTPVASDLDRSTFIIGMRIGKFKASTPHGSPECRHRYLLPFLWFSFSPGGFRV
jgi:hypothetical protein